ncbi:NADH:ubiquinone oxidoreductase [Streptomyces sp. GMY01]|uniref:NADH-quinone oxidoreductase subunit B family protein n=1 Tax=Streptomyces sp. GMY02 TaxID=1333528 RepID=UPI00146BA90F|nr:NADH:ubiquinone oxidoreductase [Streptomyces sp. GMY02]NMO33462.1 NADH:ubiquinone oxidoreductase [Streptomyces sp. GMY02]
MPWFTRGLREGIVTTAYPRKPDPYARDFPAALTVRPAAPPVAADELGALCPTGALSAAEDGTARLDRGRCILCRRCVHTRPDVFAEAPGAETAVTAPAALVVPETDEDEAALRSVRARLAARTALFRRSLHIRHVDAGSDGSEEWEIAALTNPVYDIHRLGLFMTASPRHADVLIVTGAGARGMAAPLRRTYEATAQPVVVIAAGADACSGGMWADTYATHCGIGALLDVDIWVPGSPPSPFSLLQALLLATGRLGGKPSRTTAPARPRPAADEGGTR